jgi:hypothetical protein
VIYIIYILKIKNAFPADRTPKLSRNAISLGSLCINQGEADYEPECTNLRHESHVIAESATI